MRIKHHVSVNIDGILKIYKRKKITFMQDVTGRFVSDAKARMYLNECKEKGYKYMPNDECEGFDPYEKGCPGHVINEENATPEAVTDK